MSFLFNSIAQRGGYGAIMYNGSATGISSSYPFFTSRRNLSALPSMDGSAAVVTINTAIADDYWLVMPGYTITLYNSIDYVSPSNVYSNETGTAPKLFKPATANATNSVAMSFKGTNIPQPPVGTYATLSNGIAVSNFANTFDITYNLVNYRVYEFYTGSTGTISFTGSSTVSNIQCLLIGGGGGGGMYINATYTAAGAGGAGTFLTMTFSAIPGSTFTVTVGAGGAGAAANTTNAGSPGSSTSITRTYNSVVDATLTVGGGGGGGAQDSTTGTIGTIYGSTGGTGGQPTNTGTTAARAASTAAGTAYTVTGSVFTSIAAFTNIGGNSSHTGGGGGGGGAGGTGGNASGAYPGGAGGTGKAWTVTGSSRLFAGGGGGVNSTLGGTAGAGGSGGGGSFANPINAVIENTGSGGAGSATIGGGKGADGICIIAIPI